MSDDTSKLPPEDGQSPRMSEALGFHILNTLNDFRTEVRKEIQDLRSETRTEIHGVRDELRTEIQGVRDELHTEIQGVRDELHKETRGLDAKIGALDSKFTVMLISSLVTVVVGFVVLFFTVHP